MYVLRYSSIVFFILTLQFLFLFVLHFSVTTINWKINLVNQFTWYWVYWKDEKSFWSAATAFDVWREVQISFFALLEMDVNLLDFYTLQTESDFKKSTKISISKLSSFWSRKEKGAKKFTFKVRKWKQENLTMSKIWVKVMPTCTVIFPLWFVKGLTCLS